MLEDLFKDAVAKLDRANQVVEHNLASLRTGRASVHLLDGIRVSVYGAETPLIQVATLSTPDGSTILVQPWDKNIIGAIEKAILQANVGLTPSNDGKLVRLTVPALTEETRKEIVKRAHVTCEEGRIAVRNIRRHANEEIKKTEKQKEIAEDDRKKMLDRMQKLTDDHIKRIDSMLAAKEKEIMSV